MSQHPPELVERVAREMDSIDARAWNDGSPPYYAIARYCLDLAERAAHLSQGPTPLSSTQQIARAAVRRAVEGA